MSMGNNIWTPERQQLIYFIVNMENVKDLNMLFGCNVCTQNIIK